MTAEQDGDRSRPGASYPPPGDPAQGIRVTVHNHVDGTTTDLLFPQETVRIGRNRLNDLVLNHEYVSQWHAILGIAPAGELVAAQVGSSNSAKVGQQRLVPSEEVALAGQPLHIAPFELHAQLMPLPADSGRVRPDAESPGAESPGAESPGTESPGAESPGAESPGAESPGAESPRGVIDVEGALPRVALQVLDRLAEHFTGQRIDDPAALARFGARLERTLDVFLRCFVALQQGQTVFRDAMDIKVLRAKPGLRAVSQTELATMLLAQEGNLSNALEEAFKDIMTHQVALLKGLMAGVQTLLAKLSPRAVTKRAQRAKRSPSARLLWDTYIGMHRDLAEEDNATFETIFGRQFSSAYTALAGVRQEEP